MGPALPIQPLGTIDVNTDAKEQRSAEKPNPVGKRCLPATLKNSEKPFSSLSCHILVLTKVKPRYFFFYTVEQTQQRVRCLEPENFIWTF